MTIPLSVLQELLTHQLGLSVWPFFRIAGAFMVAPVFGARLVPSRIRLAMTVAATVVIAPVLPPGPTFDMSLATGLVVAQEVVLGIAMGFCLQMIFDALVIGGQTIALGMGLGLAMMIDPQRGVSVPVVSQFFVVLGFLIFLALGGHLATVRLLADSFTILPVGDSLGTNGLWSVVAWGGQMFTGAVRVALPAVTALLVVNIALGVMSRAAPTLNLFAVGLPVGLLVGFLILMANVGNLASLLDEFLGSTLAAIGRMLAA